MPDRQRFILRKIILPSLVIILALGLGAVLFFWPTSRTPKVFSDANENLSGFAWSSNFGWISFNSSDCDTDNNGKIDSGQCGSDNNSVDTKDYGVKIDRDIGDLSGHAWSSNVGWISFERSSETGNPPGDPFNGGSGPIARAVLRGTDAGQISGWAKVLNMGGDGWIKLRCFETECDDYAYGVSFNPLDGKLAGWAWNGNGDLFTPYGLGWISFNSKDCDIDNNLFIDNACNGDNTTNQVKIYAVQSDLYMSTPVLKPVTQAANPNQCNTLVVNWDPYNGIGQSGFKIYKNGSPETQTDSDIFSASINGLNPGVEYSFKVSAFRSDPFFETSLSNEMKGTTASVCRPAIPPLDEETSTHGLCPDQVQVVWEKAGVENADQFLISRYQLLPTDNPDMCNEWDNYNYESITGSGIGCSDVTNTNCDTDDGDPVTKEYCRCLDDQNKAGDELYCYIIAAVDFDTNTIGASSTPSGPVQPCPPLPTWREVKVKNN